MPDKHYNNHPGSEKRLILIIGDEELSRVQLNLPPEDDYEAVFAGTPESALSIIRANCDKLSLILVDPLVSEIAGSDFLRTLENDPELKDIPVALSMTDTVHSSPKKGITIYDSKLVGSMAHALTKDFESIYYVDPDSGEYVEFNVQGEYGDLQIACSGTDFFEGLQERLQNIIYSEDWALISTVMRKESILQTLEEQKVHSVSYRVVTEGQSVYHRMKIAYADDGRHLVIGISDVQAQFDWKQAYDATRQETMTYARIAQALAKDYYSIYMVDPGTDEFIEYSSSNQYQELRVEQSGVDFFEDCRRNVLRLVYEEDREMALAVWDKPKLMAELESGKPVSATYRLLFDGVPVYINAKIILLERDQERKFIIIGISNVDDQMKRERELNIFREKANRDDLTGVKSRHAYMEMRASMNEEIAAGKAEDFAVVVCDINGLKIVNDAYGHQAGNRLIQTAAGIICEIFKHSPVYRVGGDEFVIILQGHDYRQREVLVRKMADRNRSSKEKGGVVIACGMAEWTNGEDHQYGDVFARADAAMYKDKTFLKNQQ